jgi:hypothetical protein
VGVGAALAVCALIAGLPGLAFAVGIYLPLGTLTPIFVGGIVRRLVEARRKKAPDSDPGVLGASGMIAGEGLAGVLIAFLVAALNVRPSERPVIGGVAGTILGVAIVVAVCALIYRAGRSAPVEGSATVEASTSAK